MKKYWKKQFLTVWIAIFAILLSALGSSISSALTLSNSVNPGLTEICSTANSPANLTKATKASQSAALKSNGGSAAHAAEHCPFCLPHAGDFSLPPPPPPCCFVADEQTGFPALFYQAPSLLSTWVSAHPRGPPLFS